MIEPGLAVLILFTGFAVSCLSGLLGIGGGIVMAPALLYRLPPSVSPPWTCGRSPA